MREHLVCDSISHIFRYLQNSQQRRTLYSDECFSILDYASTTLQLKIKEAIHIQGGQAKLHHQATLHHQLYHVKRRCEGAANARTFLTLLLIYAVSNVYFQTKTSKTHLFGTNNSPAAPRIAIGKNLEYFAGVLYRCGKSKLQLTSMGYQKLPVAAIRWGKKGNTTLAVPGHDPPFEITIFNDIALNPGPATSVENWVQPGYQVMIEHRSENLLRAPILTYSRQQLMDLRRQRFFPSSTVITLLKQCGIFKFRG